MEYGSYQSPISIPSTSESDEDGIPRSTGRKKTRVRIAEHAGQSQKRKAKSRYTRIRQPCDDSSSEDKEDEDNKVAASQSQPSKVTPKNKPHPEGKSLPDQDDESVDNNAEPGWNVKSGLSAEKNQGDTNKTCGSPKEDSSNAFQKENSGDEDDGQADPVTSPEHPPTDNEGSNAKDSSEAETSDSSITSGSILDAQNPINESNYGELELRDVLIPYKEVRLDDIPKTFIGGISSRHKSVDVRICSAEEFSVEIFSSHHQTGKRRSEYPTEIAKQFCRLPDLCRRVEFNIESHRCVFFFKMAVMVFQYVKEAIRDSWTEYELDGIENAVVALVKYNHVADDQVLDSIGHEYAVLRINQFKKLRPYQTRSICFAHQRQARCILADASGMGKRVEAIITCYLFEDEWPVIILCSTSQQQHWLRLLKKWLPNERKYTAASLETPEDCDAYLQCKEIPDFTIIGYTLLGTEAKQLKKLDFKIVIIDESHKIKHAWTTTTKAARKIIKRAKRRLLLTSNPAFGVPDELFYQLHVIDREAFGDCRGFAHRYCGFESKLNRATGQITEVPSRHWRHAKNHDELKHLLHNTVMIRHLKSSDANVHQPIKRRKLIKLDFRPDERTKRILEDLFEESQNSLHDLLTSSETQKKARVFTWYKKSGKAKMMLICKYLDQVEMSKKTIIYARHKFVLNGIEELLKRKRVGYVRIRGNYDARTDLSDEFNEDDNIKVALLSLNISQVGVHLTNADMVIFTELYWVPDAILRNEDRAWNFFEPNESASPKTIDIKYLLASELDEDKQVHMDLHLWEMLEGKIDILLKLGLIEDNFQEAAEEEIFRPTPSDFYGDLHFSDLSSNESDPEFIAEEEESEPESSDTESNPSKSSEFSDEDNTNEEEDISRDNDNASRQTSYKSSSPADSSQKNSSAEEEEDEEENVSPAVSEQKGPAKRITRSQSHKSSTTKRALRQRRQKTRQSCRSGYEDEDDDDVFLSNSDSEADDEEDDEEHGRPKSKSKPKPKKGGKTRRKVSKNESSSHSDSSFEKSSETSESDTEDSEEYEAQVKKAKKTFCRL